MMIDLSVNYPYICYRVLVTFDRSMFSEQNGTIVGFSVIVKEVY